MLTVLLEYIDKVTHASNELLTLMLPQSLVPWMPVVLINDKISDKIPVEGRISVEFCKRLCGDLGRYEWIKKTMLAISLLLRK